jgi:hypothetical protein
MMLNLLCKVFREERLLEIDLFEITFFILDFYSPNKLTIELEKIHSSPDMENIFIR